MYTQSYMDAYYKRVQDQDFEDQRLRKIAADHAVMTAQNRMMDQNAYRAPRQRPQFTESEMAMIRQYEAEEKMKKEAAERDARQREENERRQKEEAERVRLEAKRKRVIECDQDLQNLRRAIKSAEMSKYNHDAIMQRAQQDREQKKKEQEQEQAALKEMEEIAAREDQERTEVQRRIRDETNAFMQDMI